MPHKQLLITSDDFGMCHAVNRGIVRAMTEGVVRSTNFLVPCSWFPEAFELARRHQLPVGLHLCLTCDWDRMKWRPLTKAPSLCDASGHFLPSYAELGKTARDEEMYAELQAQVECVERLGFSLTHADSHMFGSSMSGAFARRVRDVIERVCSEHELGYTYAVQGEKLAHFDAELGLSGTPHRQLWNELEACGPGRYHLIGHAAEPSSELEALCSPGHPSRPWTSSYRVADLLWYTSPQTRDRLTALGFELVGARDVFAR
jgi:chitin disaccharide deacetylase